MCSWLKAGIEVWRQWSRFHEKLLQGTVQEGGPSLESAFQADKKEKRSGVADLVRILETQLIFQKACSKGQFLHQRHAQSFDEITRKPFPAMALWSSSTSANCIMNKN